MTPSSNPILDGLVVALRALVAAGWEPPFYWAAIGANGSIMGGEYQLGPDDMLIAEVTTRHIVGTGLAVPVNVMFTDTTGRATNVLLRPVAGAPSNEEANP